MYVRGALPPITAPDERHARRTAFLEATQQLRAFLEYLESYEVPLSAHLFDVATGLAGFHNLNAHDALVVAVAQVIGVTDVVALDRDLRRVDGITLWQP